MHSQLATAYQKNNVWQFRNGLDLLVLARPQANEIVLDIGCGTGELTYQFARSVLPNGTVTAIDPDTARIKIAENNMPTDLNNIIWKNTGIENLPELSPNSLDLIYSNYVLHWIRDQRSVAKIISFLLKKHGRFCMQTVIGIPEIVKEITLLMGHRGEDFLKMFYYSTIEEWQSMLSEVDLTIDRVEDVKDYYFANFDEFITWWEATTNGVFSREYVEPTELAKFAGNFAHGLHLYSNETLRFLAHKEE